MSWHIEVCGTKEAVIACIDEQLENTQGMPQAVGDYLKNAVMAIKDADYLSVHLESIGHRPIDCSGASEKCIVRAIRNKPWAVT